MVEIPQIFGTDSPFVYCFFGEICVIKIGGCWCLARADHGTRVSVISHLRACDSLSEALGVALSDVLVNEIKAWRKRMARDTVRQALGSDEVSFTVNDSSSLKRAVTRFVSEDMREAIALSDRYESGAMDELCPVSRESYLQKNRYRIQKFFDSIPGEVPEDWLMVLADLPQPDETEGCVLCPGRGLPKFPQR